MHAVLCCVAGQPAHPTHALWQGKPSCLLGLYLPFCLYPCVHASSATNAHAAQQHSCDKCALCGKTPLTCTMMTLCGWSPSRCTNSIEQRALPPQFRDSTSRGSSFCSEVPSAKNKSRNTCSTPADTHAFCHPTEQGYSTQPSRECASLSTGQGVDSSAVSHGTHNASESKQVCHMSAGTKQLSGSKLLYMDLTLLHLPSGLGILSRCLVL